MSENNPKKVKQQSKRRRRRRPIILTAIIRLFQTIGTLILVGALTGSMLCCYAAVYIKTAVIPSSVLDMTGYTMAENSIIYYYDDDGNPVVLAELSGAENRQYVEYEQIPEDLINAFVAIEDKRFWEHGGVDWYRTAGALVNMFFSMQNTFGGSTITQQLVKNVTGNDDGTVKRKITEIFTALDLESRYEKEDILEWYLNEIYLGNGCYGVQAAAQAYFGKDVSELTLAECASLAGITNNPSLYGPYSDINVVRYQCNSCSLYTSLSDEDPCEYCGAHDFGPAEQWDAYRWNKARQVTILKEMAKSDISVNGAYITEEEYNEAVEAELVFARDIVIDEEEVAEEPEAAAVTVAANINPWYVDAVISELISDLMEMGYSERSATNLVYSGGLSIYTPYDPHVQEAVDTVYTNRDNLNYVSKTGQLMSSAITVIDNSTGYVVAMAGDMGEKTLNRGWNNALSNQQPGSSFKPLAVYAPAIEFGLITPGTIIDDNPGLLNDKPWPVNAPRGWNGLTTITDAVRRSVNTVAVNVLEMVTPEASYQFVTEKFGITTLVDSMWSNDKEYSDIDVSPMAMGGLTKGVNTFEMAAAYAVFPRNGIYTEPTTYLLVEDINHIVLIDNEPTNEFVIKETTAYYINSMLTEVVTSGTGYYARVPGQLVAGKTGTTNDDYDMWFTGYTAHYTAAVWTGYPYNEDMNTSSNPAVSLWQKVMAIIHQDLEKEEFYVPDGLRTTNLCLDCGMLATTDCANDLRGDRTAKFSLFRDDIPTEYCKCHVPVTICTKSPILDENGEETGAYYLAGDLCPEDCRKEVTMVDYERELAKDTVEVKDYFALYSILEEMEEEDRACKFHVEDPECICTEACSEESVNEECPACSTDPALCIHAPKECVCDSKCTEGHANMFCSVCCEDVEKCEGIDLTPDPEPSPDPDPEPEPEPDPEPGTDPEPEETSDPEIDA